MNPQTKKRVTSEITALIARNPKISLLELTMWFELAHPKLARTVTTGDVRRLLPRRTA